MADTRTSEQGSIFAAALLRDFIRAALDHDAVEPGVMALLHDHVVGGLYHPSVIAESLRPMIDEILNTATNEDWNRIAGDLIADAREALQTTENDSAR